MNDELEIIKKKALDISRLGKKIAEKYGSAKSNTRLFAESAYNDALVIERTSREILSGIQDDNSSILDATTLNSGAESSCCSVHFLSDSIVKIVIDTPPILKKSGSAKMEYQRKYCAEIQENILKTKPKGYPVFKEFFFIFVQYTNTTAKKNNAYYDNDNLAIKAIIDSIVPLICIDDCAQFCSNIFLSEEGQNERAEIFLVKKGHLFEWYTLNSTLSFCQEFHG